MTDETTSTVEQEIANAFAEFAADPAPAAAAAATKTPEEQAAETAAAATAAAATKTPEELAAEADAAKAAAAAATKTPEELAAETAAAATAQAEADAAATAAAAAKAPVEDPRIAEMQAQIEALKPRETPAPAAPIYTADEEATLKKYAEDWPDIQKAEALARRAEYRELVGYVFKEFNQELAKVKAEYAPALDYVENRSGHDQYSDIVKLVPDYDQVRDKTLAWVDSQPEWLKAAYKNVAENGTPSEVAGLIGLYKKETGATAAPAAPAAPAAQAAPAATLAPAAKAAAAKLTVVKTGRSEAGTAAEETFENAFAAYAADEDKRLSRK